MTSALDHDAKPTVASRVGTAPGDDPSAWRLVQNIADASFSRGDLEVAVVAGQAGNWGRRHLERSREVAPGIFMVDLFDAGGGPGERAGMSSKWLCYRVDPTKLRTRR